MPNAPRERLRHRLRRHEQQQLAVGVLARLAALVPLLAGQQAGVAGADRPRPSAPAGSGPTPDAAARHRLLGGLQREVDRAVAEVVGVAVVALGRDLVLDLAADARCGSRPSRCAATSRIATRPPRTPSQNSSRSAPCAVIAPMPVTTTRSVGARFHDFLLQAPRRASATFCPSRPRARASARSTRSSRASFGDPVHAFARGVEVLQVERGGDGAARDGQGGQRHVQRAGAADQVARRPASRCLPRASPRRRRRAARRASLASPVAGAGCRGPRGSPPRPASRRPGRARARRPRASARARSGSRLVRTRACRWRRRSRRSPHTIVAPRARAASSASSTRNAPPSPSTVPSRSRSYGAQAAAPSSLRRVVKPVRVPRRHVPPEAPASSRPRAPRRPRRGGRRGSRAPIATAPGLGGAGEVRVGALQAERLGDVEERRGLEALDEEQRVHRAVGQLAEAAHVGLAVVAARGHGRLREVVRVRDLLVAGREQRHAAVRRPPRSRARSRRMASLARRRAPAGRCGSSCAASAGCSRSRGARAPRTSAPRRVSQRGRVERLDRRRPRSGPPGGRTRSRRCPCRAACRARRR